MMLLATDQLRTRGELRRQSARRLTAKIVGPGPIDLLADVANWPSIDVLMHHRSLAMIATQGIPAWLGFGGRMRDDGLLSFGSISDVASRVLGERVASLDGFLWVDDSGTSWAVLPSFPGPDDEDRPAFAFSWNGIAWPLDAGARRWAPKLGGSHGPCLPPRPRLDSIRPTQFRRLGSDSSPIATC